MGSRYSQHPSTKGQTIDPNTNEVLDVGNAEADGFLASDDSFGCCVMLLACLKAIEVESSFT